ncbi:V0D/AC39 family V-type ATPase subunit [Ruminococcus difficilis]|uniref:V-type ATPase subunit n=1 Tax=Ruminococcus difficilis TaxID=2763069 RepID=A0A934WQG5_9FIRM|nr:V-type ATPase subunit [Ruminococcus difficilis]MBK6087803.1 V-type ATPase subunit [Ruminococcus difficilis]
MQQDFTYAVARIRFRETKLLSDTDLNALLMSSDVDAVMRLLRDKGWGDNTDCRPEELLALEENKLWEFINETVDDISVLNFLLIPNDYHNLKVILKCITRDQEPDSMLIEDSVEDAKTIYKAIKSREYGDLPEYMQEVAQDAMTTLLQTSDGQLCDIIVDKACMEHVYRLGKESKSDIIRLYCELFVVAADIKIAIRCANTKKKLDFIRRALAECDTLDVERLAQAACEGKDEVIAYLGTTEYRSAVDAIETSMSAFEKWCDDYMTNAMKPQKWEPFGIGPVVAYIIARQNEIKAVRMILSAKLNNLSENTIKERLRDMYV